MYVEMSGILSFSGKLDVVASAKTPLLPRTASGSAPHSDTRTTFRYKNARSEWILLIGPTIMSNQITPQLDMADVDLQVLTRAFASAETEKSMSLKQSLRTHWKAAFWSICLSLALVMEGYDLGIVHLFS